MPVVVPVNPDDPSENAMPINTYTQSRFPVSTDAAAIAPAPDRVIHYIRGRIERGELRAGDRLPPERELARLIGVSRPTLRSGLRTLAAMRVVDSRHGFGTYVASGPPALDADAMALMVTLHGVSDAEMMETRRVIEVPGAVLAASRATRYDAARLTRAVDAMYAAIDDPDAFLEHDRQFHRELGQLSGNPMLAALIEMFSASCDLCRRTDGGRRERRAQATLHRRLALAIQTGDAGLARQLAGRILRVPGRGPVRGRKFPDGWFANAS
jgi:GntR family transcriptional repressor for pyruvate dehydrogenase complex